MPSKSRRRRRNMPQNRLAVSRPAPSTPASPSTAIPREKPAYSTQSTPVAAPTPLSYPYISGEIKRIGIVAGIIIVVLVIAAVFLR